MQQTLQYSLRQLTGVPDLPQGLRAECFKSYGQEAFGDECKPLQEPGFRPLKCWVAAGSVYDTYRIVEDKLAYFIRFHPKLIKRRPALSFTSCLIGQESEHTGGLTGYQAPVAPVAVLHCADIEYREKAYRLLKIQAFWLQFLASYPDFQILQQNCAPVLITMLGNRTKSRTCKVLTASKNGQRALMIKFTDNVPPILATIGGIFEANGRRYALSVGHMLCPKHEQIDSSDSTYDSKTSSTFEFEDDDNISDISSDEDTESENITNLTYRALDTRQVPSDPISGDTFEYEGSIVLSSTDFPDSVYDWSLCEVDQNALVTLSVFGFSDQTGSSNTNRVRILTRQEIYTYAQTRTQKIFVQTSSRDLIEGVLIHHPRSFRALNTNGFVQLYAIRTDEGLRIGDCGSWVLDEQARWYGHVIAVEPETCIAYFIDAASIVNDIQNRTAREHNLDATISSQQTVPQFQISDYLTDDNTNIPKHTQSADLTEGHVNTEEPNTTRDFISKEGVRIIFETPSTKAAVELPVEIARLDDPASPKKRFHLREVARTIIHMKRIYGRSISRGQEKLCAACSGLQLSKNNFTFDASLAIARDFEKRSSLSNYSKVTSSTSSGFKLGNHRLGRLSEIMRRQTCPLCRFICDSLTTSQDLQLGSSKDPICIASWQISGRELDADTKQMKRITRRLMLHWDSDMLEDSYLVPLAPRKDRNSQMSSKNYWNSPSLFVGKLIGRANLNLDLVTQWLRECNSAHGIACQHETDPSFEKLTSSPLFGVVDTYEMRLASLPKGELYATLSHRWRRENASYWTLLANIQARLQPGSLGAMLPTLPQIFRDTFNLVRGIGLRYIWIDSLCIAQDSDQSKQFNISHMDMIYSNADVTICAIDEDSVEEGLRAFSGRRKIMQRRLDFHDFGVVNFHPLETYIRNSEWYTRAWTLQELLLSRRCLFFAGERLFFECRCSVRSEDIIAEQPYKTGSSDAAHGNWQLSRVLSPQSFNDYMEIVTQYTERSLSRPEDILAAFHGLANVLERRLGYPLIYGLPSSHFDLALLWAPTGRLGRQRSDRTTRRQPSTEVFPSWAWCGWEGSSIEYRHDALAGCLEDVHKWHTDHTWINWYIRDVNGDLRLVWDHSKQNVLKHDMYDKWQGYGNYKASVPPSHLGLDPFGRPIREGFHEKHATEFAKTMPEFPFSVNITSSTPVATQSLRDRPMLQFWTWSAYLRVVLDEHNPTNEFGDGTSRYDVADHFGDWCGTVVLNDSTKWKDENFPVVQFIAISEAQSFGKGERDNYMGYDLDHSEQSEWRLFYVLLLKQCPGGVVERLGLGKVFKAAFQNSFSPGSQWKEFIMS